MRAKVIAVDFDGTLCENKWPEIGEANEQLISYLKAERDRGTKLILWTCRCGRELDDAIGWCEERGLYFDAVNNNLPELVQAFGDNPRKVNADLYLDDKALRVFKRRTDDE